MLWLESWYCPQRTSLKEPVIDPDAGMLAKECTKLEGFAPHTPLLGSSVLTSCNLLRKPKTLTTKP